MHQRKSKTIILYIFLLIFVGSINNIELSKLKLDEIKKINISGLTEGENLILEKKLRNLNLKNIFFLDKKKINEIFESNTKIQNYEIFKKYPSGLIVDIEETIFFGKINLDGKIYLVGSNGKLSKNDPNIKLPYVFGKPNLGDFIEFKKNIDESKFSFEQIQNIYFFPSKRWDIEFKNKVLLKLPKYNTKKSLNDIFEFINYLELKDIKIIDARIKNQIILND